MHMHRIEQAVNRKTIVTRYDSMDERLLPTNIHAVGSYQFTFLRGFKLDIICAYCMQFAGASESPHSIKIDEVKEM